MHQTTTVLAYYYCTSSRSKLRCPEPSIGSGHSSTLTLQNPTSLHPIRISNASMSIQTTNTPRGGETDHNRTKTTQENTELFTCVAFIMASFASLTKKSR